HGAEAGWRRRCRRGDDPPAGADFNSRRPSGGEQLCQGEPESLRPVPARAYPFDSARIESGGEPHLRDVLLDAGDRDATLDFALAESLPAGSRGIHASGTLPSGRLAGVFRSRKIPELAEFLLRRRPVPEILGAAWFPRSAQAGDPARRRVDARQNPLLGWLGRDLSVHDVRHHGARCSGLSEGSPRSGGSDTPVHEPDGGRPARVLLPAVLLAGLGYSDRPARSGRIRMCAPARAHASRGLAAFERSAQQGRLERKAPECRAVRLVLRIRQRVVSRYRRYGPGAAG